MARLTPRCGDHGSACRRTVTWRSSRWSVTSAVRVWSPNAERLHGFVWGRTHSVRAGRASDSRCRCGRACHLFDRACDRRRRGRARYYVIAVARMPPDAPRDRSQAGGARARGGGLARRRDEEAAVSCSLSRTNYRPRPYSRRTGRGSKRRAGRDGNTAGKSLSSSPPVRHRRCGSRRPAYRRALATGRGMQVPL